MEPPSSNPHELTLAQHRPHTCPWWLGWILANPLRRWLDNPDVLIGDFVRAGDRVLEVGPGPGFYTLPMATRVGATGKVYCIDVQPRMLEMVRKRLGRHGLGDRIEARLANGSDLGTSDLAGTIDKAVLICVLHEVSDPKAVLTQVHGALRPGGQLLLVEPKGHCSPELFAAELWAAERVGFEPGRQLDGLRKRQAAVLTRP